MSRYVSVAEFTRQADELAAFEGARIHIENRLSVIRLWLHQKHREQREMIWFCQHDLVQRLREVVEKRARIRRNHWNDETVTLDKNVNALNDLEILEDSQIDEIATWFGVRVQPYRDSSRYVERWRAEEKERERKRALALLA